MSYNEKQKLRNHVVVVRSFLHSDNVVRFQLKIVYHFLSGKNWWPIAMCSSWSEVSIHITQVFHVRKFSIKNLQNTECSKFRNDQTKVLRLIVTNQKFINYWPFSNIFLIFPVEKTFGRAKVVCVYTFTHDVWC